jgi:putative GTP pyrophosphokinase
MKIIGLSLRNEFERRKPAYQRLMDESLYIVGQALATAGIKTHSVLARIKDYDSFKAKVDRKTEGRRKAKFDPYAEITDIAGIRIVCLFLSDLEKIQRVIRTEFDVLSEDDKVDSVDITSFGYMSIHYIVHMKATHSGPRYQGLAGIPLEIQVRTIAMDAWSTISHYLNYKRSSDVPRELQRDFHALSGLFYVADTHFEMFFKGRELSRNHIAADLRRGIGLDEEINFDSLAEYLAIRFPDRDTNTPEHISELVSELRACGYASLGQLDRAVDHGLDAFLAYEGAERARKFARVGALRILMSIYDDKVFKCQGYPDDDDMLRFRSRIKK